MSLTAWERRCLPELSCASVVVRRLIVDLPGGASCLLEALVLMAAGFAPSVKV